MATPFVSTSAQTNADAVVVMPAVGGVTNYLTMIIPSYTVAVGGKITVKNGTTVIFDTDIMVANPGPITFDGKSILRSDAGNLLEVRLGSGGLTVTGKLNVLGYMTDSYH